MFTAPDGPPPLLGELQKIIVQAARRAPRSLQRAIGPSEIGGSCRRKMALKLIGAEPLREDGDPWPSVVGTATHTWLAEAFEADNARRDKNDQPPRWLIEQRVTIREGLTGSCDLYDLQESTVIDWKNLGTTSLKKLIKDGPSDTYRVQLHAYGVGWANQGLTPKKVALVALPRAGWLADAHIWSEDFDPAVCHNALNGLDDLLTGMNVAEHFGGLDEFMRILPKNTADCTFCPYVTDDITVRASVGCAGKAEK